VLVTSETGNSVAIIDARTHVVLHTVLVGKRPARSRLHTRQPHRLRLGGSRCVGVSHLTSERCADHAARAAAREARPMGMALDAARGRLYVSTGRGGTVAVISPQDGKLIGEVAVGARPWGLALSADGKRLLTPTGPREMCPSLIPIRSP